MGNIKKKGNNGWEVLASNKATGISVNNPAILNQDEQVASVDTILERHQEDIEMLKRNIAWLALHGGGGSGGSGGGGSDIIEAECTITVNGVESGGQVIFGNDGLQITLNGISAATPKLWNVIIRVGATQIMQTTASYTNPTIFVPSSRVSRYLQNHTGNLSVGASYEDDLRGIMGESSWYGGVLESVVDLQIQNYSFNLNGLDAAQIVYEYSVGVMGSYMLNINVRRNNSLLTSKEYSMSIMSTTPGTKSIQIKQLLDLTGQEDFASISGVYNLEASLIYVDDPRVNASFLSTVTLVSDSIMVSSTVLSTDSGHPVEVSLSSSINAVWTAYLQGASTFQYSYTIGGSVIKEGATGYFGTEVKDLIAIGGKEWATENSIVSLVLSIRSGDKTSSTTYWIKFVAASDSFLDMTDNANNHKITEFLSREYDTGEDTFSLQEQGYYNGGNPTPYIITSHMEVMHKNNLSVISNLSTGMKYLRLSNGAYAVIDGWNFNNTTYTLPNLITTNQFSLSISFKADYHPDDYRTILYCGTVDVNTGLLNTGISIDVHNVYINQTPLVTLTDNVINNVDITVQRTTVKNLNPQGEYVDVISYIVKVYLDGVLTAVTNTASMPALGNKIYLGGRIYGEDDNQVEDYLCDCNIYNLQVYDTVLSDLDIMINYINNKVSTEYVNSQPNFGIISEELKKNFCEREANGDVVSRLYANGQYTIDFLLNAQGRLSQENLTNYARVLGIPIMLIDVHEDSNWTFNNFVTQQTKDNVTLPATTGKYIDYWDPTGTNNSVLTIQDVSVKLQGTSTLADAVKNLNVTVPKSTAFIPKETWLPEQTYTLKADVVDSSHSNNASIGKFINEVLGYQENDSSSYFPFDSTAIANVYQSAYKLNQQPTVTLKHTVEGFPVFLIMKFAATQDSPVSVTPLGIYSFNLGRNAYRNLGFRKLVRLTDSVGDTPTINTFPYLLEDAVFTDQDSNANWIEIKDTTSLADLIDFSNSINTNTFDSSKGDFWQNDDAILNARYEVRYPANRTTSQYPNFKTFVGNIMSLPIEGTYSTDNIGQITKPQISTSYELYTVDSNNNYTPTGELQDIVSDINTLAQDIGFNKESAYKYFVIALLFGLIDNFGKNSTYRSWNNGQYFIDFYDLDSALGGSNQGQLDIYPDTWIKYLTNALVDDKPYGYVKETYDKNQAISNTVVSASHNKLWVSLDTQFFRAYHTGNADTSLYTTYWYNLRLWLDNFVASYNAQNNTTYDSFVDLFIDKYYIAQTGQCGPLLFNYDYKLKYLLQFTNDSYAFTKDLTKLHGRKIAYARNWLKNHILFLDSLFYWRDSSQPLGFKNNVDSKCASTVFNTPDAFPMMSNTPVIMYNSVGNQIQTFYFMQKNVKTYVNAAHNSSNSIVNWNFSNSPNIIQFGDTEIPLSSMNVNILAHTENAASIDYVGFPAITELHLSGNSTFGQGFGLASFEQGPLSELRILDFSSTNGTPFTLELTKTLIDGSTYTKYTKLQKVDISQSRCVADITIPNVPLLELAVRGSSIQQFVLKGQKYLPSVDLTGCTNLSLVDIEECDGYTELTLNNLSNLRTVKVLNCPNITSINISNCKNLTVVDIENNRNLTSITVSSCGALTGSTATNYVTISQCSSLEHLDLHGCSKLTKFYIAQSNQSNISYLDISNTRISKIEGDGASDSLLDLSAFTGLTSSSTTLKCANNLSVEYIQLANVQNSPIYLNNTFQGCTKLKRLYGNMIVNCTSCFKQLPLFSIHGSNATKWKGYTIKSNGRVRMPYELLGVSSQNLTVQQLYASGTGVTNMIFNKASETMRYTNYTIFDVYYALSTISGNVNLYLMFAEGQNTEEGRFSFANSPDRNIFVKCSQCTTMSQMFWLTPGVARLYSPTVQNGVFQDDGVYSPIANNANTTIYLIWGSITLYYDKNLFRTNGNGATKRFTNISFHNPAIILPVDYNDTVAPTQAQVAQAVIQDPTSYGDLTNFFVDFDTANVMTLEMDGLCSNTLFLNHGCNYQVPSNVKSMKSCFVASYSVGELILANHFVAPGNLLYMYQCFRTNNAITGLSAQLEGQDTVFNIRSNVLQPFSNLIALGYYDGNGSFRATSITASIGGAGIIKQIAQNSFPIDIISTNTNLQMFSGFFQDCKLAQGYSMQGNPQLPGDMFVNNTKLTDTSSLFNGLQIAYNLTGQSFRNCPNIQNVSYMFANSQLQGFIPTKLLFHGWELQNTTITKKGTNEVTDNNGTLEGTEQTATLTGVNIPRKNISNAYRLFYDCRYIEPYNEENPQTEKNEEWNPWIYVKNAAGEWIENIAKDTIQDTIKWAYDGNIEHSLNSSEIVYIEDGSKIKDTHIMDDNTAVYTSRGVGLPSGRSNLSPQSSVNFMCAPDLLRYCVNSSSLNIQGLFENCGQTGLSRQWSTVDGGDPLQYGVYGRICPWLLKPVSNVNSISSMFTNCKKISYYQIDTERCYTIPRDFFAYAPNVQDLSYAFKGMLFPGKIDLNVFTPISTSGNKNLAYVFANPYFGGTSTDRTIIDGIFNRFSLSSAQCAFACQGATVTAIHEIATQYITFTNIFKRGYTSAAYQGDSNFSFVFAGYSNASGYIIHENPKTMFDAAPNNNYTFANSIEPETV